MEVFDEIPVIMCCYLKSLSTNNKEPRAESWGHRD